MFYTSARSAQIANVMLAFYGMAPNLLNIHSLSPSGISHRNHVIPIYCCKSKISILDGQNPSKGHRPLGFSTSSSNLYICWSSPVYKYSKEASSSSTLLLIFYSWALFFCLFVTRLKWVSWSLKLARPRQVGEFARLGTAFAYPEYILFVEWAS